MQMFPWFGTIDEGRNYVNLLSHAKWQEVEAARLDVYESVKNSWYRLVLVHRRKEYLKEHLEWVQRLMQLTRSRVESGYASRSDMLQLEMEKVEIESMLEALNINFLGEQARFNALLNRNSTQQVTLPDGRPEITWELTYEETLNMAITYNPSIINLEILDKAGESMERRAKLEGYPMIGVGAEIMGRNSSMQMDGSRIPIYANFTIRLPIWRKKYKAIVSQAQAERKVIEYELSDKIRNFQAEISTMMSVYQEADVRVKRYRDALLPKSRELTDLLLLDYSNGRIRLDEVILMRRRSVEYATMLEEAIFDRNMATVSIQRYTAGVE
jgi:outer membrane protein TolC